MPWLQGLDITSKRLRAIHGIDFSHAEEYLAITVGETMKFYGGTLLGYDHATRGGLRLTSVRADEYAHGFAIEDSITCTKESRKGALYMYSERPATSALTAGWGGGEDQLMNLTLRNYGVNTGGHGMRGIDLNLRQRSSATTTNMYGILCTLETDSGTDTTGNAYAGRFVVKFNGVHSGTGTQYALEAACESQTADQPTESGLLRLEKQSNSNTLDTKYGMHIDNNAAAKAITHGIYLSGTITNVLSFAEADGSQGFTAVVNKTLQGNVDGYFTIYDITTGATLYVNCYDTVPS
ncbi:MAG: hypothetical protein ACXABY_14920 [Candidatus Thorarchaeota archaeon]|jgi:hypothetical protein